MPAAAPTGNPTDVRKRKGIHSSDSGWEEVTAAPSLLGLPVAEIGRTRILQIARGHAATDRPPIPTDMAPPIEWGFRYVYMLETLRRDELTRDGRADHKDRPVEAVRELQDGLLHSAR